MTEEEQIPQNLEPEFTATQGQPAKSLKELMADNPLFSELVKAETLVGETFFIIGFSSFESQYEGQGRVYHVLCDETNKGDFFRTVLGGKAIVPILDAIAEQGITNPVKVTLGFVDGGKYGGYYTIE